eukprot:SAG22_NODE_2485_length_2523_cov_1.682756_3_plen_62_part_00
MTATDSEQIGKGVAVQEEQEKQQEQQEQQQQVATHSVESQLVAGLLAVQSGGVSSGTTTLG